MSSSIDNILNNICFIISDLIVLTSSLVTVSVTRIIATIFEILKWRRGLVVIATAQQCSRLKIRLNAIRR